MALQARRFTMSLAVRRRPSICGYASVVASAPVDAAPAPPPPPPMRTPNSSCSSRRGFHGDGDGYSDEEGAAGGEVTTELSGLSRVAHITAKSSTPSTAAGGSPRTPMSYQRSGARWVRQGGGAMLAFDVNSGADEALHLSLSLLPSRVLALPATLVRVGSLVGASLAGFEAEMENAFAAAASDAATALAASRAVDICCRRRQASDPPINRLHLHGP